MTPADIAAAQPGTIIRDAVVPGLQLRAFPGSKAFYLYYRTKGGRQRKPKLGNWPTLTLPRARTVARAMLDAVAGGGDPSQARQDARVAPTVADLCDRYMLEWGCNKKSAADDERLIRLYIKPKLGRERVAELSHSDVDAFHRWVPRKVTANRAVSLLSKAMNLAGRWGWRAGDNPCRGVRKNREAARERYMTAAEAIAVAQAMERRARTTPPCSSPTTGTRRSSCGTGGWPRGPPSRLSILGSEKAISHIWLGACVVESGDRSCARSVRKMQHVSDGTPHCPKNVVYFGHDSYFSECRRPAKPHVGPYGDWIARGLDAQ
jgi:hypothetical protein